LPEAILRKEIELIKYAGVKIECNVEFGKDINEDYLRKKGYGAVFMGIGAHESVPLKIPGEELEGYLSALEFLKKIKYGEKVKVGKRVIVVGGGNAAIDSARSALRLGALEVIILYRRSRKEMPAIKSEVDAAENEGIKFIFLSSPIEILGHGRRLKGIKYLRMKLGEPDESGRRRPVPIKDSERFLEADNIISAVGQRPEISKIRANSQLKITNWQTFSVDPQTMQTNIPGIFAGGDAVTGPATAIEAIAAGKKAAFLIAKYLKGKKVTYKEEQQIIDKYEIGFDNIPKKLKVPMPHIEHNKRLTTFHEVESGYTQSDAIEEAQRCLNCSGCSSCKLCEKACEAQAINYSMKDKIIGIDVDACIVATGFETGDNKALSEYGYGRIRNVIRAMEFERLISASGPTQGALLRPSDGEAPKKIALIQCVGSRDERLFYYCSSVCCMHATKEAILAHEHDQQVKSFIFYTDLRAIGKGFQEYILRAQNNHNVRYIRSRPGKIFENGKNGKITIEFEDTIKKKLRKMKFDLVVLCEAMFPYEDNEKIAKIFNIEVDDKRFFTKKDELFNSVDTEISGVFACGFCNSPQDIPESVVQASAGAARVSEYMKSMNNDQ